MAHVAFFIILHVITNKINKLFNYYVRRYVSKDYIPDVSFLLVVAIALAQTVIAASHIAQLFSRDFFRILFGS
jgi:hypothetical protein